MQLLLLASCCQDMLLLAAPSTATPRPVDVMAWMSCPAETAPLCKPIMDEARPREFDGCASRAGGRDSGIGVTIAAAADILCAARQPAGHYLNKPTNAAAAHRYHQCPTDAQASLQPALQQASADRAQPRLGIHATGTTGCHLCWSDQIVELALGMPVKARNRKEYVLQPSTDHVSHFAALQSRA